MQPRFDDPVTVGVASRFQPGAWHPSSIVFGASMGLLCLFGAVQAHP